MTYFVYLKMVDAPGEKPYKLLFGTPSIVEILSTDLLETF